MTMSRLCLACIIDPVITPVRRAARSSMYFAPALLNVRCCAHSVATVLDCERAECTSCLAVATSVRYSVEHGSAVTLCLVTSRATAGIFADMFRYPSDYVLGGHKGKDGERGCLLCPPV